MKSKNHPDGELLDPLASEPEHVSVFPRQVSNLKGTGFFMSLHENKTTKGEITFLGLSLAKSFCTGLVLGVVRGTFTAEGGYIPLPFPAPGHKSECN